ncbi:MAG: hypothetical protein ACREBD_14960 [Blastocatellia bacterium]
MKVGYFCALVIIAVSSLFLLDREQHAQINALPPLPPVFADGTIVGDIAVYGINVRQTKDGNTLCQRMADREARAFQAGLAEAIPDSHLLERRATASQNNQLQITLRVAQGVENNPQAKVAIQRAAAKWESIVRARAEFAERLVITVDADFAPRRLERHSNLLTQWQKQA